MRHISELSSILRSQFFFDKRKRSCLAQVIMGMISCRTVNLARVIVKSGVLRISSSGAPILCLNFNSIFKLDAGNDFCQAVKPSQLDPVFLSTHAQFEQHMQHPIPG